MDYQNESKQIHEGGNYWKPKPGQFKVKALSELVETEPFIKKVKDDNGNETEQKTEQIMVMIMVDSEEKRWTFSKGKTPASTYGQLVDIAVKNNNTLVDLDLTVIVKSDGTKNDYTIVA